MPETLVLGTRKSVFVYRMTELALRIWGSVLDWSNAVEVQNLFRKGCQGRKGRGVLYKHWF